MSFTPHKARMALLGFLAVSALAIVNILYFQDETQLANGARAKVKLRAEAERSRRLALLPKEGLTIQALIEASAPLAPESKPQAAVAAGPKANSGDVADASRTGRFAAQPGFLDKFVTPAHAAGEAKNPGASGALVGDGEMRLPEIVKGIQAVLGQKGYEPGTADGIVGLATRAAIMAYEHDHGLPISGEPTDALLRHLKGETGAIAPGVGARQRAPRSPSAEHVIRSVQQSLAQLGYFSAKIDGRGSEDTQRAIREFEMDAGLVPTGRVSAPLLNKLSRTAGGVKAVQR